MTDNLNPIAAQIHGAICQDSPTECADDYGVCIRAAEALCEGLPGWRISEHTSTGEDVDLLHSECCDEAEGDTVATVNEMSLGALLTAIAEHDCEDIR